MAQWHEEHIEELEDKLEIAEKALDFYGNVTNWVQIINGNYNLGKIWVYVNYENRFMDNSITTENGKVARQAIADIANRSK